MISRRLAVLVGVYIVAVTLTTAISGVYGPLASVIDSLPGIGLAMAALLQLRGSKYGKEIRCQLTIVWLGALGSLSANLEHPRIAVASVAAFMAACLVGSVAYNHSKALAVVTFALVDSLIFPWVAFGSFTWWVVGGQVVAKIIGAAAWTLLFTVVKEWHGSPKTAE